MSDVRPSLRLLTIASHLSGVFSLPNRVELGSYRQRGLEFNVDIFRSAVEGATLPLKKRVHEFMQAHPELFGYKYYVETPREKHREQYVKQLLALLTGVRVTRDMDEADPRTIVGYNAAIFNHDQGLCTRLSVHNLLYGDSLKLLGTQKHSSLYDRMITFKDYGCFCMTELGHGSNVSGVETVATYNHANREFIIHSPSGTAAKWWIGALGKTANMAVVFAQLIIGETNYGVHVFAIPIRDYKTHDVLPGLTIGDCGPKEGLAGIDNGFMLFNNYRVPYDTLLDRFSQISPDGKFKSSIKNKEKRFSAMLAGLCRGRIGVLWGTESLLRNSLTAAIRYAAVRRQFGPKGEVQLLDYPVHRYRLMPHLANSVACCTARETILTMFHACSQAIAHNPEAHEVTELHALISITKPMCTWYSQRGIQECRESLGGTGYSMFSRVGQFLADNDVNATWEGANWILLQQTSRYILKNMEYLIKGQRVHSKWLEFLTLNTGPVSSAKAKFTTKDQLRGDIAGLKSILTHRVQALVSKAMLQLQKSAGQFNTVVEAWNHSQVGFINNMTIAFGELFFTTCLLNLSEDTRKKCPKTGDVLLRLAELYAYSKLEKDLGTLREHDYFSTEQGQLLSEYVMDLCNEIGESSVRIVDAYAFPDIVHGSPLGYRDGQVYKNYTDMVESWPGTFDKAPWLGLVSELRKAL